MMRMLLTATVAATALGTQAFAQSCDTLGGGVNCNVGRADANNPVLFEKKTSPRAPDRAIGPDKDALKVIETDTSVDPYGRPKATLGGTTFYSDGRLCTRIGLTVTCK